MSKITNAKSIQKKSKVHVVTQLSPDRFQVCSGGSGNCYDVAITPHSTSCTCTWGQYRKPGQPSACSHVISVVNFIEAQNGRKVSAWTSEEQAAKQHRPTIQLGELTLTTRRAA